MNTADHLPQHVKDAHGITDTPTEPDMVPLVTTRDAETNHVLWTALDHYTLELFRTRPALRGANWQTRFDAVMALRNALTDEAADVHGKTPWPETLA